MSKLFKISLGILGTLLAVVVVSSLLVKAFVDPNDYKPQIQQAVKEQTGRDLTIKGDIELSVFPWLAARLGQTTFSNGEGFGESPMAEIQQFSARIKLLPLLSSRIEIGRIELSGLSLRLEVDQEGRTNWQFTPKGGAKEQSTPSASDPSTSTGGEFGLSALSVEGIDISDADIDYTNAQSGQAFALKDFYLSSGTIRSNSPIKLDTKFDLSSREPQLSATIEMDTELSYDLDNQQYELAQLVIDGLLRGEQFGGEQPLKLSAAAQVDMKAETADLSDINISFANVSAAGKASFKQLMTTLEYNSVLELKEFSLRKLMASLGQPLPKAADNSTLTRVKGDVTVAGSKHQLDVSQLQIQLDDSTLKGSAKVTQFDPATVVFNLEVDRFDADRYLPPESASENQDAVADSPTPEQAAAAKAETDQTPVDLSALDALNLQGSARIGWFKINNLEFTEMKTTLNASNGKATLKPLGLKLYGGSLEGMMSMSSKASGAQRIVLKQNLTGFQFEPFTTALMGEPKLSGVGNLDIDINTKGVTVGALRQNLNGKLAVNINDGAVYGFNLAKILRDAQAMYKGEQQPLQATSETKKTDFAAVTATATIVNGVLDNQDLTAASPAFRLGGAGTVDLYRESLNYLAKVSVVGTSTGQDGRSLEELKGITLPVRVTGSFAFPNVKVALDEVAKAKAQEKIDAERERARQKLREKEDEAKEKAKQKVIEKLNKFF